MISREEETKIEINGNWEVPESQRLCNSWFNAMAMNFKIPEQIRYMEGMSGKKYRYLINNLVSSTPDARYLEIGSWMGSTVCSAIWGNKIKATCIDNWQFFGGPKYEFLKNIEFCKNENVDFTFIENDYAVLDYSNLGKYNIYMFDGPHEEYHQYAGIVKVKPALDQVYTLIVDDWNWASCRNGTINGLRDTNQSIIASIQIRTTLNEEHPKISGPHSDWHNGYLIAVVKQN